MEQEQQRVLKMARKRVNMLTSMMPTMEGLFIATVLDGKEGRVAIRYHNSVKDDIDAFIQDLLRRYPDEVALCDSETST